MLTEHSFGVRSLAFSSDSQYLATLGDMNDGFLFVWAINLRTGAAKLHSTNKCTSFIRDMCWMGQTLITYEISIWPPQFILTFSKGRSTPCQGLETRRAAGVTYQVASCNRTFCKPAKYLSKGTVREELCSRRPWRSHLYLHCQHI